MTTYSSPVRTAARVAAVVGSALSVLLAVPAGAVPENWSDPDPVSGMEALLVFVILPGAVFVVVWLLASLPALIGKARSAPSVTEPAPAEEEVAEEEAGGLDALLGADEPALESSARDGD